MASESELVERHADLVRRVALQMVARLPASVELDDLIQAGNIGLLDAIRRYRRMPQAQFETYATQRVRGAMLDELRRADWLPRSLRDKCRRIADAVQAAEHSLGRVASEQEVASQMGVSLDDYHDLLRDAHGIQLYYAEDLSEEAGGHAGALGDGSAGAGDPLEGVLLQDLRGALLQAIDRLPERERLLLSLIYQEELNIKEVAAVMAISEGRVCQLRTQAVGRIRAHLQAGAWSHRPDSFSDASVF
ncbi:MAG: RNA polymerase sigma factor FliA [Comamonas sp.]